jgi:tetratricopeptide (TPR) repeat protein
MAMVNKGISLGALNRSAEAIQVYDELVALYKERPEPQIAEKVARALVNKGKILIGLDRPAEAEAVFIEAIEINPAYTKTHIQLINLLLNIPGREDEALMKASEVISANPENASLLNSVAWNFYEHGSLSGLEKAQEWAQSAVLIKPEASAYQHTLACILAACGSKEALVPAKKYIQDDSFVEQSIDDAIQLFVVLAAAGYAKEALGILVNSPAAKHLEPLVAGLRLFIGEKLTTAVEILEVAKDVVKRIEERMRRRF